MKRKKNLTEDPCFQVIDKQVDEAIAHTTAWEQAQKTWYRLRMRIKKAKTTPFVGCSNIRMPTAEIKIRKLKASIHNTIFGIRPVIQAIPSPSGSMQVARKIEKFLDHLICNVIKLQTKAVMAIDQELEKGFYLLKPFWRLETTKRYEELSLDDLTLDETKALYNPETPVEAIRAKLIEKLDPDLSDWVSEENLKEIDRVIGEILDGKDKIKIKLKDVLYDAPDVALCPPERVFVPVESPVDPQRCKFICQEMFKSLRELKQNTREKGWDEEAIKAIESWKGKQPTRREISVDTEKDLKEGISRLNSPLEQVRIWEYYGWYDIDNDGEDEKCLITLAPDFNLVLRKITLPFDNGKFPFVKLAYELTDDRWFSHRGIPELLEDIIKEIDVQHMQKIDSMTIRNAPMFVYRAGMVNPSLVKFMPSQGIPVNGMNPLRDTIDVMNNNNPNIDFSYEKEQMILETKVEELIGQVDFTLQSMINKRQPRTLGEVQLQQQNMQLVFSLDANMHTESFSELFSMIWDLWCQYGSDAYEFSYFGEDGWEQIKLTREEIQGKYKITVRGNDQNTNSQVRIQKAQMVFQASANPIALQTGVVKPHHLAEAYDLLYKELDIPEHQRLHEDPEVLFKQYQQSQMQPPPPPDDIKLTSGDLTEGEMAQVLSKRGINPDMQGRILKSKDTQKELDANVKKTNAESDKVLADIFNSLGEREDEPEQ